MDWKGPLGPRTTGGGVLVATETPSPRRPPTPDDGSLRTTVSVHVGATTPTGVTTAGRRNVPPPLRSDPVVPSQGRGDREGSLGVEVVHYGIWCPLRGQTGTRGAHPGRRRRKWTRESLLVAPDSGMGVPCREKEIICHKKRTIMRYHYQIYSVSFTPEESENSRTANQVRHGRRESTRAPTRPAGTISVLQFLGDPYGTSRKQGSYQRITPSSSHPPRTAPPNV